MGGKEQNSPIYISRIIPGGVADRHGGLKRGDQLLSVNGVSVEGENHEKAVELLKQVKNLIMVKNIYSRLFDHSVSHLSENVFFIYPNFLFKIIFFFLS